MATNRTWTADGSYKDAEGATQKFTVEATGYTDDKKGLDAAISDYGPDGIVALVNKARETSAVNTERTRLTKFKEEQKKQDLADFARLKNASSPEERLAIMKELKLA